MIRQGERKVGVGRENNILSPRPEIKHPPMFPFEFRKHQIKKTKEKNPGSSLLNVNNRTIQSAVTQGNFFLKKRHSVFRSCATLLGRST